MIQDQSIVYVTCIARRGYKHPLDVDLNPPGYEQQEQQQSLHSTLNHTNTSWKSSSSSSSLSSSSSSSSAPRIKRNRDILSFNSTIDNASSLTPPLNAASKATTLIGSIHIPIYSYIPSWLFYHDLSTLFVQTGQAYVLSSGLLHVDPVPFYSTLHKSVNSKHVKKDVQYIQRLLNYEYKAIQNSVGFWSVDVIRKTLKPHVLQEVEFQTKASAIQKLWRRIRG